MTDLFISDLHLDQQRPGITQLFLDFLDSRARYAQRLFILGDLFESWVGDDHHDGLSDRVATGLKQLSDQGTKLSFIHGNRDFLLGKQYARRCGMELLVDPSVIHIDQQATLLCHGDTLCIDDLDYQAFRQQVRDPQWQEQFLSKPLSERLEFARQARERSATHTATAPEAIMDVNKTAVAKLMHANGVKLLIHGHTHRPAIHQLEIESGSARRIVLGDWYEKGSVLVARHAQLDLQTIALR